MRHFLFVCFRFSVCLVFCLAVLSEDGVGFWKATNHPVDAGIHWLRRYFGVLFMNFACVGTFGEFSRRSQKQERKRRQVILGIEWEWNVKSQDERKASIDHLQAVLPNQWIVAAFDLPVQAMATVAGPEPSAVLLRFRLLL